MDSGEMTKQLRIIPILALSIGLAACNLPLLGNSNGEPLETAVPNPLVSGTATALLPLPATATATITPTPTNTATPTATATPIDPWESFAAPTVVSATEIPRPVPAIAFPDGVVNVILLGSDERPNEYGHRTDTLMIVSMDPNAGTVTLLSIPRDLYVYIPGWRVDRVNVADAYGGPDMVAQTILYNFGIRIDHWVRINFSGFRHAIDTLGGIDVEITGYLSDLYDGQIYEFRPGTVRHMDGWVALGYVRMRHTTGDLDRLRRQQEVVRAIFAKVVSLEGLTRIPDLFAQFSSMVETDLTVGDLLPLIPLATSVSGSPSAIRQLRIDSTMVTSWRVPRSGAAVLLPNRELIQAMIREAFGP